MVWTLRGLILGRWVSLPRVNGKGLHFGSRAQSTQWLPNLSMGAGHVSQRNANLSGGCLENKGKHAVKSFLPNVLQHLAIVCNNTCNRATKGQKMIEFVDEVIVPDGRIYIYKIGGVTVKFNFPVHVYSVQIPGEQIAIVEKSA